jgi:hypothetical protein
MESWEYDACVGCLHLTANGEYGDGSEEDQLIIVGYEAWHDQNPELHLVCGGEHRDTCTPADRDEGCDCDDLGFSWRYCDICSVPLGGDRYRLTAFRKDGS